MKIYKDSQVLHSSISSSSATFSGISNTFTPITSHWQQSQPTKTAIMLFQSTLLFGLFATSFALPAPEPKLVARAKIPAMVQCDGKSFSVS
jgi:hypothetical protein